jgi:hypothetical protein
MTAEIVGGGAKARVSPLREFFQEKLKLEVLQGSWPVLSTHCRHAKLCGQARQEFLRQQSTAVVVSRLSLRPIWLLSGRR